MYVGNPGISGLGACVIVINYDGLNMVYQNLQIVQEILE